LVHASKTTPQSRPSIGAKITLGNRMGVSLP
jgi:hypothetical protein